MHNPMYAVLKEVLLPMEAHKIEEINKALQESNELGETARKLQHLASFILENKDKPSFFLDEENKSIFDLAAKKGIVSEEVYNRVKEADYKVLEADANSFSSKLEREASLIAKKAERLFPEKITPHSNDLKNMMEIGANMVENSRKEVDHYVNNARKGA